MKRALLLVAICSTSSLCQTSSSNSLAAKQIIERSISALSPGANSSSVKDYRLNGFMQIADSSQLNQVKILARGDDMRLDVTMHNGGTHSVVFLKGSGRMRTEMGKEIPLSSRSRAGTEIAFLPTPGVLFDLLGSAREATLIGDEIVNGNLAHHVIISRQYPRAKDPLGVMSARSRTEFFIDAKTFLILKVQHLAYDARGQKSARRELEFADYRSVDGLILPFSISEISDGQKSWTLTVEFIELKPQLTDKDFRL